jgi:periplasmic divalent cation tolerance protein
MTDKIVVFSTCRSADEAEKIARGLVEKKLAACVNVVSGVRSIYRWKDSIENESEVLLVIKSSRELFDELRKQLEKIHTYEIPEAIALPIVDGSERYLDWLGRELVSEQPTE